jgi:hypothetical protein
MTNTRVREFWGEAKAGFTLLILNTSKFQPFPMSIYLVTQVEEDI